MALLTFKTRTEQPTVSRPTTETFHIGQSVTFNGHPAIVRGLSIFEVMVRYDVESGSILQWVTPDLLTLDGR